MMVGIESAIENGDYSDIMTQLKEKRDPNVPNMVGALPLEIAAWRGDQKLINLLLKAGADPKLCTVKDFFEIKKIKKG
jgi:ankyrin repeat protein